MTSPVLNIFTDGACHGNPGPGGWGAMISSTDGDKVLEVWGGAPATTNNRMELTGAVMALRNLPQSCVVNIHTDSKYVQKGMTEWLPKWQVNGWMTSAKQPVKNSDLWKELSEEVKRHAVHFTWVKGHAGHPGNERADYLANHGLKNPSGGISK